VAAARGRGRCAVRHLPMMGTPERDAHDASVVRGDVEISHFSHIRLVGTV